MARCARALPAIAAAAEAVAGRLAAAAGCAMSGAGTSGRIALQDAAECAPTFGTDPASSSPSSPGAGRAPPRQSRAPRTTCGGRPRPARGRPRAPPTSVVGLSASGRTPYVLGALRAARAAGALTVAIANAPGGPIAAAADLAVEIATGAGGARRLDAADRRDDAEDRPQRALDGRDDRASARPTAPGWSTSAPPTRSCAAAPCASSPTPRGSTRRPRQRALAAAAVTRRPRSSRCSPASAPAQARERLARAGGRVRTAIR